jgi:hypothetical protein
VHSISALETSAQLNHSHTGITTVGDGGHQHRHAYSVPSASGGGAQGIGNAAQTPINATAPFTVPIGSTGDGRHTHTFTSDMSGAHSHTVSGSTGATGNATIEVDSVFVLIY